MLKAVDSSQTGIGDIDKAFVGKHLEMIPGVFVCVGTSQHSDNFPVCRKGYRPLNMSTSGNRNLNYFGGGFINDTMIK